MNDQRIQELAKQATIRINNPTVNSNGKVICDNWEEGISISKFAELIVRDCMNIVHMQGEENIEAHTFAFGTNAKIMKHFYGVEE